MRDRARDWSEHGRQPRLSLAPVCQLLWTRKERDCVQSSSGSPGATSTLRLAQPYFPQLIFASFLLPFQVE